MQRFWQSMLLTSTVVSYWLGMQSVHELGHVLGAIATGARVERVVLHPLTISRTDVTANNHPLVVVWGGPVVGVLLPILFWLIAAGCRLSTTFLFRCFAGFCLIANGAYIAFGAHDRVGDCDTMLQHGSPAWMLWLFCAVTIPAGLFLWHRHGEYFGLGPTGNVIDPRVPVFMLIVASALIVFGLYL